MQSKIIHEHISQTILSIAREYSFEMGHALMNHKGKCFNIHGHNYRLEVEVYADHVDNQTGMIMDFQELDDVVKPVIRHYDHKLYMSKYDPRINALVIDPNVIGVDYEPTAENLVQTIYYQLDRKHLDYRMAKHIDEESYYPIIRRVTLYETDKASATIFSP